MLKRNYFLILAGAIHSLSLGASGGDAAPAIVVGMNVEKLNQASGFLERVKAEMRRQLQERMGKIQQLEADLQAARAEVPALLQRLDEAVSDAQKKEAEVRGLKIETEAQRSTATGLQSQLERTRADLDPLRQQLADAQERARQAETTLAEEKARLEDHLESFQRQTLGQAEELERLRALGRENQTLKKDSEENNRALLEKTQEIETLQQALAAERAKMQELGQLLTKKDQETQELASALTALTQITEIVLGQSRELAGPDGASSSGGPRSGGGFGGSRGRDVPVVQGGPGGEPGGERASSRSWLETLNPVPALMNAAVGAARNRIPAWNRSSANPGADILGGAPADAGRRLGGAPLGIDTVTRNLQSGPNAALGYGTELLPLPRSISEGAATDALEIIGQESAQNESNSDSDSNTPRLLDRRRSFGRRRTSQGSRVESPIPSRAGSPTRSRTPSPVLRRNSSASAAGSPPVSPRRVRSGSSSPTWLKNAFNTPNQTTSTPIYEGESYNPFSPSRLQEQGNTPETTEITPVDNADDSRSEEFRPFD